MWVIILFTAFEAFLLPEPFFKRNYNFPLLLSRSSVNVDLNLEKRFGLDELSRRDAVVRYKNLNGRFSYFGQVPYQEYLIGLGFGYPIKSSLAIGLGIDGLINRIEGYGVDGVYAVSGGLEFKYKSIHVISLIKNFNTPQLVQGDSIPLLGDFSVQYYANETVSLMLDFQSTVPFRPTVNAGTYIRPATITEIILGLRSEPMSLIYGLTIILGQMELKYLGNLHHKLGLSHSIGLGFKA